MKRFAVSATVHLDCSNGEIDDTDLELIKAKSEDEAARILAASVICAHNDEQGSEKKWRKNIKWNDEQYRPPGYEYYLMLEDFNIGLNVKEIKEENV